MTKLPAVRVRDGGGGGPLSRTFVVEGCLTQGRELKGRTYGSAHQFAKRTGFRAACGHRVEHVFGIVQSGPDGTRKVRGSAPGNGRKARARAKSAAICLAMPRSHAHALRVRYSECDPQGHVFNANFFTYFDIALTELWRAAIGSYNDMVEGGVDMVVAEASARYLSPARFDDVLDIEVTVAHLGTTSMVTEMAVSREDLLLVEGRMVHVFIDRETTTKTEIPDRIREALS